MGASALCMQAKVFLRRIAQNKGDPNRILKKGELFALGKWDHVQGTLFCDGAHLYSAALAKKIDDIAKKQEAFILAVLMYATKKSRIAQGYRL